MGTRGWRRSKRFDRLGLNDGVSAKVHSGSCQGRYRQRGAGAVEYLLITGFIVAALMVPFGSENKNAVQQLMDAIRSQQAAYNYSAKLPALPNLDGDDTIVPEQGGGSSGGNDTGDRDGIGSDGGGSGDDSASNAGVDEGSDSATDNNQDDAAGDAPLGGSQGSDGAPGPADGDFSDLDLGEIIDSLPADTPWEETIALRQLGVAVGAKVSLDIGVAELAALRVAACMLAEKQNPYWTADDIAAYKASSGAYKDEGEEDWDRYDKDLASFEKHGIEFPVNKDELRVEFDEEKGHLYSTDSERDKAFKKHFLDTLDGFAATLTQREDRTYILAFRGSETHELSDWINNKDQAIHGDSVQYNYAVQLAIRAQEVLGNDVLLAGHSLGGGLATAASHVTGWKTITFNAAGVHPNYKAAGRAGPTTNHYVRGEILTTLQNHSGGLLPKAGGVQVAHSQTCNPLTGNMVTRHFLDSFTPPAQPGWERPNEKEPGAEPVFDAHGRVIGETAPYGSSKDYRRH